MTAAPAFVICPRQINSAALTTEGFRNPPGFDGFDIAHRQSDAAEAAPSNPIMGALAGVSTPGNRPMMGFVADAGPGSRPSA
jgi:hypothetical protein